MTPVTVLQWSSRGALGVLSVLVAGATVAWLLLVETALVSVDSVQVSALLLAWAGTVLLTSAALGISAPLGLATGMLLSQGRARPGVAGLRSILRGLEGVPSVAFGLAGAALWVEAAGLKTGAAAVVGTLVIATLPLLTSFSERALRGMSQRERLAALALGARPFQVVLRLTLRRAQPQLVWGMARVWSRALGATMPFLLVAPGAGEVGRQWLLPVVALDLIAEGRLPEAALASSLLAITILGALLVTQWSLGKAVGRLA